MKRIFASTLGVWLALAWFSRVAPAQEAVASPPSSVLDKFPELITKLEEEVQSAVVDTLAVVEAEAVAGRLTETAAQSLRWTLRTATTAYAGNDMRGLLATARVPFDNAAVSKAFAAMEVKLKAMQAGRTELCKSAAEEAVRRVTALLDGEKSAAEIDALAGTIEGARAALALRSASGTYSSTETINTLAALSNQARQLQKVIEAEQSKNAAALSQAISSFMQLSRAYERGLPESKLRARAEKAIKPFQTARDEAQRALDVAIETGKPLAELQPLLNRFEETSGRYNSMLAYGLLGKDSRSVVDTYCAIVGVFGLEAATYSSNSKQAFRTAADSLKSLDADRAVKFQALLAKREAELGQAVAAAAEVKREKWRNRIASAKDPAALNQLASEIRNAAPADRSGDQDSPAALANQLAAFAAAWGSASPVFLQQSMMDRDGTRTLFAAELATLRKRIERDILARSMRAPELNQPPLAEKEADAAIDALGLDLARRQEWRRLLQLVEARQSMQVPRGYVRESDIAAALRAFIAGENFEIAEQWADAVDSYKIVLRSTDERAPIQAAADRLKELKKQHPDAFAARPGPAGLPAARPPGN